MATLTTLPWIGNAAAALCGLWGAVTARARRVGCSRQTIYQHGRRAARVLDEASLAGPGRAELTQQLRQLHAENAQLWRWLEETVEFPRSRQQEFAATAAALGLSVRQIGVLLRVVLARRCPSRGTLGGWTQAHARQATAALQVLDRACVPKVQTVAVDEIFCRQTPVLMAVEPRSMTWLVGQRGPDRTGQSWYQVLVGWSALNYVVGDAGHGIAAGVAQLQQQRRQHGGPVPVMHLDVFHTQKEAGVVLRRGWRRAEAVWERAEAAERRARQRQRRGENVRGSNGAVWAAWHKARQAFEQMQAQEQAWQQAAQALEIFRPDGTLNDRAWAQQQLAQALPGLAGPEWAKTRHLLQDRRSLAFLDRLQAQLPQVEANAELRQALLRLWWLRRQRGRGEPSAATEAACVVQRVVCAKLDEHWPAAYRRVAGVLRQSVRASSVVECLNSVTRMHQARHRHLTQGLLDVKRLYWNCRPFAAGKRRGHSPYQFLGLALPSGHWWTLLQTPPDVLAQQLSTP